MSLIIFPLDRWCLEKLYTLNRDTQVVDGFPGWYNYFEMTAGTIYCMTTLYSELQRPDLCPSEGWILLSPVHQWKSLRFWNFNKLVRELWAKYSISATIKRRKQHLLYSILFWGIKWRGVKSKIECWVSIRTNQRSLGNDQYSDDCALNK